MSRCSICGSKECCGGELEQERDQLKARVMELERFIKDIVDFRSPCGPEAARLLKREPPQSLKAHDREVAARAVMEFGADLNEFVGNKRDMPIDNLSFIELAEVQAASIRAGGE